MNALLTENIRQEKRHFFLEEAYQSTVCSHPSFRSMQQVSSIETFLRYGRRTPTVAAQRTTRMEKDIAPYQFHYLFPARTR
jgi:hypothetical protein